MTLIQIKNHLDFFISDKPEPGYHVRREHTYIFRCRIDTIKKQLKHIAKILFIFFLYNIRVA